MFVCVHAWLTVTVEQCPWGRKAFTGYLGADEEEWKVRWPLHLPLGCSLHLLGSLFRRQPLIWACCGRAPLPPRFLCALWDCSLQKYDATELVKGYKGPDPHILVDQVRQPPFPYCFQCVRAVPIAVSRTGAQGTAYRARKQTSGTFHVSCTVQGTADTFFTAGQLLPENFAVRGGGVRVSVCVHVGGRVGPMNSRRATSASRNCCGRAPVPLLNEQAACGAAGIPHEVRMQEGYDHRYKRGREGQGRVGQGGVVCCCGCDVDVVFTWHVH